MEYTHVTKNGEKILLKDLNLSHLQNIINLIERKAEEGLKVMYGGGHTYDEMWYDEEILYGEDAKKELGYHHYIKELKRRENTKPF
jgi:hypothetical protein